MTPYKTPRIPAHTAYDNAHTKTRVLIEQTFGRWKCRFHVLHGELRMAPEKVCQIIGAYAVLHNIAINRNEPMEDGIDQEDELFVDVDHYNGPEQGLAIRDHICNTLFA